MKKVIVRNLNGYQTHQGIFATQEQAEAWVSEQRQLNSWGLDVRWVDGNLLNDAEKATALDQSQETIGGEVVTYYQMPAQYSVEISDPSFDETVQSELAYRARARQFGNELIDYISVVNETKGLTMNQLLAVLSNQSVMTVSELLKVGSLIYARQIILGMDESIYTANEKATVVTKIEAFLTANGKQF